MSQEVPYYWRPAPEPEVESEEQRRERLAREFATAWSQRRNHASAAKARLAAKARVERKPSPR
jgi:hypothetical protein